MTDDVFGLGETDADNAATPAKRRAKGTSPTQRSNKWLRERGWQTAIVEHWNPHVGIRQDLWGFGDLVACKKAAGCAIVQTTSGSNLSARVSKVRDTEHLAERARTWLESGGRIYFHGWAKRGDRGKRKLWTVRVGELVLTGGELVLNDYGYRDTPDPA